MLLHMAAWNDERAAEAYEPGSFMTKMQMKRINITISEMYLLSNLIFGNFPPVYYCVLDRLLKVAACC